MKVYVMPDPNETKVQKVKRKAKEAVKNAGEWIVENRETIVRLAPIVVGGLTAVAGVAKVVGKRVNLHKQEQLKDLYCYDRSLGHYWKLRRELSNKEWLEIDTRKKKGERLADILAHS